MTQPEANIVKCFPKQQLLLSIPEPAIALDYHATYWWISSLVYKYDQFCVNNEWGWIAKISVRSGFCFCG